MYIILIFATKELSNSFLKSVIRGHPAGRRVALFQNSQPSKRHRHYFLTLKTKKNMTKKLISAQEILALKGFKQNKFDTQGFQELVARFFMEHEVSSTILLSPRRFVTMDDAPECGYIDCTDPSYFTDYEPAIKRGYFPPVIYVDEPFIKNAAHMLALMGGYVVKKRGTGAFIVSLV